MICAQCGFDNPEGMKFCGGCGAALPRVCPDCSFANPPGFNFCGQCGRKLGEVEKVVPSAAPPEPRPDSYTPRHLAEKILATRSAVEGERKQVTVLFADAANFTGMSEALDPEDVHQVMDGAFAILLDQIHRYEGTVNQFTGDGVMALFGAPLAHEDHAQRACYSALGIQEAMAGYSEKVRNMHRVDFKLRIGLNSGLVVVGAIGDDLRMDYTAVGDVTNLAARMESLAPPGGIMVSAQTHRLAQVYFEFKPLGRIPIKGKSEPQEVWELKSVSDVVTRLDASAVRGLTRFIGRESELEKLVSAFGRAAAGRGRLVGVVGEAGVGKSRLIREFRGRLGPHRCLEGRCLPFGSSIAYLPILDTIRSYFGLSEGEREGALKEKIAAGLEKLGPEFSVLQAPLADVLSLAVDDPDYQHLTPQDRREAVFDAWRGLLIRISRDEPLLFIVDDLHWIDKTSEDFLDHLTGSLASARILVLLVYRPEYIHTWGSLSFYDKIGLDQLSAGPSADMIAAMLGDLPAAPEIRELILGRAAGNPLFMEELTRSLEETGAVVQKDGQWVLGPASALDRTPDTVQDIIAARMDRLSDEHKRVMQTAAVIGRDFAYRILKTITGQAGGLKDALLDLQHLEFIHEKRLFPELEYIFKHALTQEVAYHSLLASRRRRLHGLIGQAIEELYSERLEEFYEVLAHHFFLSDREERAYHYLRLSGLKALKAHAAVEALSFFRRALILLDRRPPSRENDREKLDLIHLMISPIIVLGMQEDCLTHLEEGARLARELGDVGSVIRLSSNIGLLHSTRGRHEQGLEYTEEAFSEAARIGDTEAMARTAPDVCLSYLAAGFFQKADEAARQMIAHLEEVDRLSDNFGGPATVYPALFTMRAQALAFQGRFDEAYAECEKGLDLAARYGNKTTLGLADYYYGHVAAIRGDADRAVEFSLKAAPVLEEVKFRLPVTMCLTNLGLGLAMRGQTDEASARVRQALETHLETGLTWNRSFILIVSAFCLYLQGNRNTARDELARARDFAREAHEKIFEGAALIWMAWLAAGEDEPGAVAWLDRGQALLGQLGARPFSAMGRMCRSRVAKKNGRVSAATEELTRARDMFADMGMNWWRQKAEHLLNLLL